MTERISNAEAERREAQRALANGDFKDRDTYTAKQVAVRCGTDSKTMRKFFRSSHSTVEPVGQGGRYEFDAADLPRIRQEFKAWRNKSGRTPTPKVENPPPTKTPSEVPLRCVLCEDIFKSKQSFAQHSCSVGDLMTDRQIREFTTTGQVVCPFCTLEFKNPGVFATHTCQGEAEPEPTEEELAALEDLDLDDLEEI